MTSKYLRIGFSKFFDTTDTEIKTKKAAIAKVSEMGLSVAKSMDWYDGILYYTAYAYLDVSSFPETWKAVHFLQSYDFSDCNPTEEAQCDIKSAKLLTEIPDNAKICEILVYEGQEDEETLEDDESGDIEL